MDEPHAGCLMRIHRLGIAAIAACLSAQALLWLWADQGPATAMPLQHEGEARFVVIADAHIPDGDMNKKNAIVATLNGWGKIDAIVALGDLVATNGSLAEYDAARKYFSGFKSPVYYLTGNHEYMYSDERASSGGLLRAGRMEKAAKLERFGRFFGRSELYFYEKYGNALFVFTSADAVGSSRLVAMSAKQRRWLSRVLGENKGMATVVFNHAPLRGTVSASRLKNNAWLHPVADIDAIIRENPQVKVWVSGHTHTCPTGESSLSALNYYNSGNSRVLNVHNCDLRNRSDHWTTELVLQGSRLFINTFDHLRGRWDPRLTRVIALP